MFIRVTAKGFPGRVCINTDFISYIVPLNPTEWDSQSGWAYDINVYALDGKNRFEFFRIKEDDAERIFKLIGVSDEIEAGTSFDSTAIKTSSSNKDTEKSPADKSLAATSTSAPSQITTKPASKDSIDQKSRLEMLKKIASSRKIN